ncbi:MAG TPA: ATP-binding cassette domain-containing protein [Candidatus Binatia bacterium]|nr:ATP-binding cassette domain-containing protein [Candidatus Binatia bacterium]
MLEFIDVEQRYGKHTALDGISVRVGRGERLALVGPSGAGKTTFFRLAYGAFVPTSGKVLFDGTDFATLHGHALREARSRIAVVFQTHGLVERLSVRANVLAGTFGKRSTIDALRCTFAPNGGETEAARSALESVRLAERLRDRVFALSGGQRQRVAIARAVVQQAELVLADEPAASLDPELAREIVDLMLADSRARGTTLICSLHQPQLAESFDRVIRLDHGRVVSDEAAGTSLFSI